MKIYLWNNVRCDWYCGFVVVMAENEAQAREKVLEPPKAFTCQGSA